MDFFNTDFFLINIGSMNIHHCPGVFLSEAGEFSDFQIDGEHHQVMENYDGFMINSLRYIRSRNVQKTDTCPGFSLV